MSNQGRPLSWPALYDPGVEIIHIQHNSAIQPEGRYLHHANGSSSTTPLLQKTVADTLLLTRRCIPLHVILDACFLHTHIYPLRELRILEPKLPPFPPSPSKAWSFI